jgi:uncharacterized repeat protein (TIGR02543 family)
VVITSSTGHGGTTDYTKTLTEDTSVILTAPEYVDSGAARKHFTGWTGSETNTNQTISLTMDGTKSVTANYMADPVTYSLSVKSTGTAGVVITSSTGHGGTTDYTKTLVEGMLVSLTAPATAGGKTFTGWTGAVASSSATISLTMDSAKSVTANYTDPDCISSTMFVNSIVAETLKGSKGQWFGYVTVTILDNCGNAVADADVVGTFTGDYSETLIATTNTNGVAIITTTTELKKPASVYTFCVDDIVHVTLVYSFEDNVQTCEIYEK